MPTIDDMATPAPIAPSLRTATAADFREAGWARRSLLLLVLAWLAYEWGIGNETVTPFLLVQVINAVPGPAVIAATFAVGFLFTLAQQFIAGITVLWGFSIFHRTADAAWRRLRDAMGREPTGWASLGWGGRAIVVFTLGTTAVALIEIVTSGRVGVRRHVGIVARGALLCALLVGLAGATAAAIAEIGRRVEVLAGPTDWILRILGNPLFWLGVLSVYVIVLLIRRRRRPQRVGADVPDA